MRRFTRNKLIYQTLKDFGFGLTLFLATLSVATLDARIAWPAAGTIAQNATDTNGRIAPFVDNITAQHNVAAFIRNSLKPEYTGTTAQTPANQAEKTMNMDYPMQFLSLNALHYTFIAILFASMFTLTFSFWHYLRREYASPRRTTWRRG